MVPVVGAACVVRLRAQGGKQGIKRGLKDRLMSVTKKEKRVDQVRSERNVRAHLISSVSDALSDFRGPFCFRRFRCGVLSGSSANPIRRAPQGDR